MYTMQSSRMSPTPQQLYRKIVKKIRVTEGLQRERLKKSISHNYQKHLSLLQSHRNREIRFQKSSLMINKINEDKKKHLKLMFQQREKKIPQLQVNHHTEKKKKLENSFNRWDYIVTQNRRKYLNELEDSDIHIQKWNSKCDDSLSKKKQRLNSISSNLNERSRISSAKTTKHQENQLERLLQKSLLNPEKQSTQQKATRVKMFSSDSKSKISSTSRVTSRVTTDIHKPLISESGNSQDKLEKYLGKYVQKQTHIQKVRDKKNQLLNQLKKIKQDKSFQIGQIHKLNNHYLTNKREEMQEKLDSKFSQDRKKNINANKSLPAISAKSNLNIIHPQQKYYHSRTNKKSPKSITIEPKYNRMVMDEIRNIGLVSKMRLMKH